MFARFVWAAALAAAATAGSAGSALAQKVRLGISVVETDQGLVIEHVDAGSPAARAGIAAGGVLRRVDGVETKDVDGFTAALDKQGAGKEVEVVVSPKGSTDRKT